MKKIISQDEAIKKLFESQMFSELGCHIEEFVAELVKEAIAKVQTEYAVMMPDGTLNEPNDEEQWYDDAREELTTEILTHKVNRALSENGWTDGYTYKLMEDAVHLSADLMRKLIDASDKVLDWQDMRSRAEFIIRKAYELDRRLGGKNEDAGRYDYVKELDRFEKECEEEIEFNKNPIPQF